MSLELGRAILELRTDDKALDKGLKDAESKSKGWGSRVAGVAGKAALAIGGIGLAAAAAGFKFAKAAAEEEAGMRRLEQAVKNTGRAVDANFRREIEAAIAEMSELSAFGDGELRESLSTLVAQTGSYEEALKRQRIAMDLARGTGMDLHAASQLLGRVTDENVTVLNRYGIEVEKGADAQTLLNEVQKRFSGQAKEFGDSAEGSWGKLQNAIGDVQEDIGALLLPTFTEFVNFAGAGIHFLRNTAVPGLTTALAELREKGAPVFEFIGGIVRDVVAPALARVVELVPLIFGSLGEVFDVLTGKRPDAGGVLSQLVGAEKAQGIMQVVARVRETMRGAFDLVRPIIQAVIDKVAELRAKFEELPPAIQAFAGAALVAKATGVDDFLLNIVNTAATVASGIYDMSRAFVFFSTVSLVGAIKLLPTWIGLQWLSASAGLAMVASLLPFIALGVVIGAVIGALILDLGGIRTALWNVAKTVLDFIGGAWQALWTAIDAFFAPFRALDALWRTDLPTALGILIGAILRAIPTAIATFLSFADQGVKAFAAWGDGAIAAIGAAVPSILAALGALKDQALAGLGGLIRGALEAFAWFNFELPKIAVRAVEGFVRGIFDAIPGVIAAAKRFAERFLEGLKRGLGIRSPSTEAARIGDDTALGLAMGLTRSQWIVGQAAKALHDVALEGLAFDTPEQLLSRPARSIASGRASEILSVSTVDRRAAMEHGHPIYIDGRRVATAVAPHHERARQLAGA